mmetsp:Transcript_115990/g.291819  ORF Transcript_115990/g.291819 Transcript_115990/m.291819 type:complete len:233 (-) Transcript_115990:406-1104(-)
MSSRALMPPGTSTFSILQSWQRSCLKVIHAFDAPCSADSPILRVSPYCFWLSSQAGQKSVKAPLMSPNCVAIIMPASMPSLSLPSHDVSSNASFMASTTGRSTSPMLNILSATPAIPLKRSSNPSKALSRWRASANSWATSDMKSITASIMSPQVSITVWKMALTPCKTWASFSSNLPKSNTSPIISRAVSRFSFSLNVAMARATSVGSSTLPPAPSLNRGPRGSIFCEMLS